MLFKAHPFPCNPIQDAQYLPYYSISASAQIILDLWKDVHVFQVSMFALNTTDPFAAFYLAGGTSGSILGTITGLGAVGQLFSSGFSAATGTTRRSIVTPISIPFDEIASTASDVKPVYWDQNPVNIKAASSINNVSSTVCGEYPLHTFSDGQGIITIDFGRTAKVIAGDIFAPYISIEFSNGMSNIKGAFFKGGVNFANIGAIPIYGNDFSAVSGAIVIKERYSDILMSTHTAKEKDTVKFAVMSPNTFSGFKNVSSVFLGSQQVDFSYQQGANTITITIPKGAESGRILFIETNNGIVNKFECVDPLTII